MRFPSLRSLALLGLLAVAPACSTISGAEARALVASGALLLDVRSPQEFADGHLAGALNIPVDTLSTRLGEVGAKDRPVVVYCRSGMRSRRARDLLLAEGWQRVENLGSKGNWPADASP